MEHMPDSELVARVRSGDKHAFDPLVQRYQTAAQRLAFRLVRSEDSAQELTQEALLQAFRSIDRLKDPARFKSWLYGIVLNVCRSHLRSRVNNLFSLEALIDGLQFSAIPLFNVPATPEQNAEDQELQRTVLDAVSELAPGDRDAILLFHYAQLSLQEIATVMDCSPGAVKVRLHRARQRLKAGLLLHHPETVPQVQRRKIMRKVTIADVIRREQEAGEDQYVIVLQDEAGKRALPMWIGPHEGQIIAMGLREFSTVRPLTVNFLANLLQTIDADVEEVRVEALKETTYYGIVKIKNGNKVSEVDARPSDAIALAVLTGSPIYVAEEVMERTGLDIPQSTGPASERKGVDDILKDIEERQKRTQEYYKNLPVSEQDAGKIQQEIITAVFGG